MSYFEKAPEGYDLCVRIRGYYFDVMRNDRTKEWCILGPVWTEGATRSRNQFEIETKSTDRDVAEKRANEWIAEFQGEK